MKRYICTYFDVNFLARGLALIDSIKANSNDFVIYVLALDVATYDYLKGLDDLQIKPIELNTYVKYFDIDRTKYADQKQFYFSISPNICLFLLKEYPEIDILLYVDADMYLFNKLEIIYSELGTNSIGVCPQRLHPIYKMLSTHSGIFNVGVNLFRNNEHGFSCLEGWKRDCDEWYPGMKGYSLDFFSDQIFLDSWPERFDSLGVIDHIGINTAPWNMVNYKFQKKDGVYYVNNTLLVIFHFSTLNQLTGSRWNANTIRFFVDIVETKKELYVDYISAINSHRIQTDKAVQLKTKSKNWKKNIVSKLFSFNEIINIKGE